MRRYMIPASIAIALAAAGCHMSADAEERDAGPKVDRSYQVGTFSKIEVAGPYEVKVVTGGSAGVTATRRREFAQRDRGRGRRRHAGNPAQEAQGLSLELVATAPPNSPSTPPLCAPPRLPGRAASPSTRSPATSTAKWPGRATCGLPSVAGGKVKLSIAGSGGVTAAGNADACRHQHRRVGRHRRQGAGQPHRRRLDRRVGQCRRPRHRDRRRVDHGIGRRRHDRRRQVQHFQARDRATSTAGEARIANDLLTMCGESGGYETRPFAALAFARRACRGARTRNYSVTSFDRIRVDGPYQVTLSTNVAPFAERAAARPRSTACRSRSRAGH